MNQQENENHSSKKRDRSDQNIESTDVKHGRGLYDDSVSSEQRKKPYVVLAGNPGVGKSTILNSLVGRAVFRAGVNFGTGLTTRVQLHETPNYFFGDTPGLSDIETREQAAREISSLLRKATYLKLFFVVTLEAGRVKPDDLTTMNLILDSIDIGDTTNKFAIIVNKIPQNTYTKLQSSQDHLIKVCASLTLKHKTSRIILVPKSEDLEDADDVVADPDPDVVELIMNCDAAMVANAQEINLQNVSEMVEEFTEEIRRINEANEVELARLKEEIDRSRRSDSNSKGSNRLMEILFPPLIVCGPPPLPLSPIIDRILRHPVISSPPPCIPDPIQEVVEPIHTVVETARSTITKAAGEAVGKVRKIFPF